MSRKRKQKKTLEELLAEALVPEAEQPYELPENWVWVRLGSVFERINENVMPSLNQKYIGLEHLSKNGGLEGIGKAEGLKSSKTPFKNGDVLYGKLRPYLNKHVAIQFDGVASTDILVFRQKIDELGIFLDKYFGLPYVMEYAMSNSKGINLPRVSPKVMESLPFPLPPLSEQKRIVDRVESLLGKIDEAKELIQEARDSFEQRRAAILDQAFRGELTRTWREQHPDVEPADRLLERIREEKASLETRKGGRRKKATNLPPIDPPYELPQGWKWVRLGEVTVINPGKPRNLEYTDDNICSFVPMAVVDDFTGSISVLEERPFGEVKKGYTYFEENDVLFAKITPCMENGKVAVAKGLTNKFGFGTTEFHIIRCSHLNIHPKLVYHLVRSDFFRKQAKAVMTGAVGQQRVPKHFLESYPFPLPPFDEQEEVVKVVDDLLMHEYETYTTLEIEGHLNSLTQSILTQAFRGELGTHDPTEESALELLKRTLAEQNGLAYESPATEELRVAEQGELYLT
ncbi:hypothetical protein GCM10007416_13650 [Kroppenstedtia guangzhouensis]|uniref:Type I restriction modification DNA specificity domain-containing protein n=1 Tax=Kroppenstedtia guangzhouensis TaxID=1274356 RepID=A0ABQ1GE01_9BACL|nr:restriction endonuclease subunit S [Kroppenstedtia guangzhouensis]GGA41986.1 hypothetical protein GCM10007416_13650 [Kroppenstedtia guangzhouensis]